MFQIPQNGDLPDANDDEDDEDNDFQQFVRSIDSQSSTRETEPQTEPGPPEPDNQENATPGGPEDTQPTDTATTSTAPTTTSTATTTTSTTTDSQRTTSQDYINTGFRRTAPRGSRVRVVPESEDDDETTAGRAEAARNLLARPSANRPPLAQMRTKRVPRGHGSQQTQPQAYDGSEDDDEGEEEANLRRASARVNKRLRVR